MLHPESNKTFFRKEVDFLISVDNFHMKYSCPLDLCTQLKAVTIVGPKGG